MVSLAQSQENSTNNFESGFDPTLLNTTTDKTQVLMTTESIPTIKTGIISYNSPTLKSVITTSCNSNKHKFIFLLSFL